MRLSRFASSHVEWNSRSRQPCGAKNAVPSAGAKRNGAFWSPRGPFQRRSIHWRSIGDARSMSQNRTPVPLASSPASVATWAGSR